MFERGPHRSQRESVAGKRATNAADVAVFEMDAGGDALGDFFRAPVGGAGNAAADGFAEDEHVGIEFPCGGAAAGAGANGMRFVGDEQRTVAAREFAGGFPVTVVGENDADIGHGGLGEHAGDVVMLESVFERVEIVEFDDASGCGGVDWGGGVGAAGGGWAAFGG